MQNHKYVIPLLLIFLYGCASVNAPKNWLPEAENVPEDPYGSWIEAEYIKDDNATNIINGELIAISSDSLYLLNDSFKSLAIFNIKSARLVKYDSNAGHMGALTVLGCVSSIANGWFLVFSSPVWLIGGSISSATRSFEPLIDYPQHDLSEFVPYGRFPQGLPASFNRKFFYPKAFIRPVITERESNRKDAD